LLAVGSCAVAALGAGKADKPTGKGPPSPEAIFKRLDANGDGAVTQAEFVERSIHKADPAAAAKMFGRVDADKDGKITAEEYVTFRKGGKPGPAKDARPGKPQKPSGKAGGEKKEADPYAAYRAIFKRLDADGDGRVTEAEYVSRTRWPEAKARAIWRASDADGDGKVTELEYCENRRVTDEAKKIFAWLDVNKDAKLTEAEAVAGAKRIFAEMDADASGGVNIPEYLGARWRWQVDIRWAAKPRERTK